MSTERDGDDADIVGPPIPETDAGLGQTKQNPKAEVKKRGRKPVSRRKRIVRPKIRGKYVSKKQNVDAAVLADCILSNDEVGADYMERNASEIQVEGFEMSEGEESAEPQKSSDFTGTVSTSCSVSLNASDMCGPISSTISSAGRRSSESRQNSSCASICAVNRSFGDERTLESVEALENRVDSKPLLGVQCDKQTSVSCVPDLSLVSDLEVVLKTTSPVKKKMSLSGCPPMHLIEAGLNIFKSLLPAAWTPIANNKGYLLFLLSTANPKAIQREIFLSYGGTVSIAVHGTYIFSEKQVLSFPIPSLLVEDESLLQEFCENGLEILKVLMGYDVCTGANHQGSKDLWGNVPEAYVDCNIFKELSYKETCRSRLCKILVNTERGRAARCEYCRKILKFLLRKKKLGCTDLPHRNTPNIFLTPGQASYKLKLQQEDIKKKDRAIAYWSAKYRLAVDSEGVDLDEELGKDLADLLSGGNLTNAQKIF